MTLRSRSLTVHCSKTLVLAFILLLPTGSWSADGIAEINQACVAVGCFAGDDPDFPVTITGEAGHSYRLTSDLRNFRANANAIQITASHVTVDLGGFRIAGRSTCVGFCAPPGFQEGVRGLGDGIELRNGSVVGFDGTGVNLEKYAVVHSVRSADNGRDGIEVGAGSRVVDSVAHGNVQDGIHVAAGCLVMGNASNDNGGDGIQTGSGAMVVSNVMRANTGHGLRTSFNPDTGYTQNTIRSNVAGTVIGGINLGANSCNGTATCP